jgi:hypothetical protein
MKYANRQLRDLLKRFARTFKLKWLPKGDPTVHDGIPPGTVIDATPGCEVGVLFITGKGSGTGLMVGDGDGRGWARVSPGSVEKAIRDRTGTRYGGRWVS